jgi:hypothetical protein
VLVALDTNIVDLVVDACESTEHVEAMEAMEPPPRFRAMPRQLEAEVFSMFWILAMAPSWRSVVYTFSDTVYRELSAAGRASALVRAAVDVLVRDEQEERYRVPDRRRRPPAADVEALGLRRADAEHIADAVGVRADRFLTNDARLRNRSGDVSTRWGLVIRRPSEYLVEAVSARAPWTTSAPWPWDSLERIRAGTAIDSTSTPGNPGATQVSS